MQHIPIQMEDITEENIQQTCESIILSRFVIFKHWEAFFAGIRETLNERGVPGDEIDETLSFGEHCVTYTLDSVSRADVASAMLAHWVSERGGDRIERATQLMKLMEKAKDDVESIRSEEDMNKMMASWNFAGAADDVEDALAMETGATIPPSVERHIKSFLKHVLGDQVDDDDIVIESLDLDDDSPFKAHMVRMPRPREVRARHNMKVLDELLESVFGPNEDKKDEEKEE
jgi:hypothetical protein